MAESLNFLINIQQKMSGGNLAAQLDTLDGKIKAESKALQNLEQWMKRINSAETVDGAQKQKVQGLIDQKKQSLAGLSEQLALTGGAEGQAGAEAAGLGEQLSALAGGPVGMVVAAIGAVIAVLVVAGYKLAAFALGAADAGRSFRLVLEGASGTAKNAKEMAAAVDRVASSTGVLQPELEKMARTLAVAGLKGKLFEDSLKTMATVASVAGPEAAAKLEEMTKKVSALGHFEIGGEALAGLGISMEDLARSMGTSVDKLKADMKAGSISVEQGISAMNTALNTRFGAVAMKQALAFPTQIAKLQENLGKLFKDVDIESFLKGLHEVLSIFDQSTSSGKAMHAIITTAFSAMFNAAAKVFPYIKAFLQGMVIGALTFYIAIKPAIKALGELFSIKGDGLETAVNVGIGAFGALLAILGLIAVAIFVAFLPLIVVGVVLAAFVATVIFVVETVISMFGAVGAAISSAFDALTELDFGAIAGSLLDGLVNGIRNGAGIVMDAIKSLGSSMISGLKGVLGIASPSKVFASLGKFTSEGFAEGVDAGADGAQASVEAMVSTPSAGGVSGGRGGAGGPLVVIEHLELHGDGAEDLWAQLEERLTALMEGMALSGPEPSPAGAS